MKYTIIVLAAFLLFGATDLRDVYLDGYAKQGLNLSQEILANARFLVLISDALYEGEISQEGFWDLYQQYIHHLVETSSSIEVFIHNVERGR